MQQDDSRPPDDTGGLDYIGEIVWIPETLVVAPSRGRFRREPLLEGSMISVGTVIGGVAVNGGPSTPVKSSVAGVFLGWLAWEGESLQRGTPLARIGSDPNAYRADPSRDGDRTRSPKARGRTHDGTGR